MTVKTQVRINAAAILACVVFIALVVVASITHWAPIDMVMFGVMGVVALAGVAAFVYGLSYVVVALVLGRWP